MTGTITYILSRAGWRAMNGPLADERRRLAGAEPPAAYVSYDPRLLAGAGWYGYRIALKGGDRQMVERARYMLSERYVIRDGYEYYADGVYVFGVLLRDRVPHYGIGGGAPKPEPDALNFYMPNGGTISLNKTGNPTVVELEYSLDCGTTWTVWQPNDSGNRSLTLNAGQSIYVRNTSETQTGFSTSRYDYYWFGFTNTVEAHGNINSLLCKNADNITTLSASCYRQMFYDCSSLVSAPELPAISLSTDCYRSMFLGCTSLVSAPEMQAINDAEGCCQSMFEKCTSLTESPVIKFTSITDSTGALKWMFYGCSSLNKITIYATALTASNCTQAWVNGVAATGGFYCPSTLTIPTGTSGIPSGWTRHDI